MRETDHLTHEFAGSYPHQQVRLTFDPREFVDPGYVLVFAYESGRLLFTRNKKRGWELPGGTREPGEWPIQTVLREVYEETGAELAALEPFGQYTIVTAGSSEPSAQEQQAEPQFVKTIYVAQVANMHPLPDGYETEEIRFFEVPPAPEEVRASTAYSPIVKDDVYRLCLERLAGHRFTE